MIDIFFFKVISLFEVLQLPKHIVSLAKAAITEADCDNPYLVKVLNTSLNWNKFYSLLTTAYVKYTLKFIYTETKSSKNIGLTYRSFSPGIRNNYIYIFFFFECILNCGVSSFILQPWFVVYVVLLCFRRLCGPRSLNKS